jgi:PIN domain nuclease of toxin-antitoxin system
VSDALLLDTHAFLWWIWDDPRLSSAARRTIGENESVFVSVASAWEIAIKVGLGRIEAPKNLRRFLADQIRRNGFKILPVKLDHATQTATLANHHRDPFDRLLIAQAIIEDATLVTRDTLVQRYHIRTIW